MSESESDFNTVQVIGISNYTKEQIEYAITKYAAGGGKLFWSPTFGCPVAEVELDQRDWDSLPSLAGVERFSLLISNKES